jgi:hypothetical protein
MRRISMGLVGGLLIGSLLGSSGCALLVALPAFGTAGYVAGREAGREQTTPDTPAPPESLDRDPSK